MYVAFWSTVVPHTSVEKTQQTPNLKTNGNCNAVLRMPSPINKDAQLKHFTIGVENGYNVAAWNTNK
jgi:hypothetical protein